MLKRLVHYTLLAVILLGVPAACAWLGGYDEIWEGVKSFPPRTEDFGLRPENLWNCRCPFSWPVFLGMAAFTLVCFRPFLLRIRRCRRIGSRPDVKQRRRPFPWWGWAGVLLILVFWTLSWSRIPSLKSIQPHISYFPIWGGYILLVNALCIRRSGSSPLTAHPLAYSVLFPVSSLFWWFFEYLNRYVWNWYYLGVGAMSAGEYTFYATICFSSVLPAVAATAAWLHTFPAFADENFRDLARVDLRRPQWVLFMSGFAALGLAGIVFFPQYTFPLLWISPCMVFLLVQFLLGERSVLDLTAKGDWSLFYRYSIAALICGLCWETWNFHAVAKWVYAVPYVHAFQIWEMPLIGFAGYLPFGVECATVTAWILPALVENGEEGSES